MTNRIIKFRAWHPVRKIMFSAEEMGRDQLMVSPDGSGFWNVSGQDVRLSQNIPMVMMQFTGLLDRNGREIYEGDILKNNRFKDCYAKVEWTNEVVHQKSEPVKGMFGEVIDLTGFFSSLGEFRLASPGTSQKAFHIQDTEVVGNVYSNPDLLK